MLAEKDSVTYAIQCKCYSNPVGNKSVQEAYSGKQYYNRMVAVVITNNEFTANAKNTAEKTHVSLWNRTDLIAMLYRMQDEELRDYLRTPKPSDKVFTFQ